MKIRCHCGEVIADQSDFLPYKARLVADMDWDDVFEGDVEGRARAWSRPLWQCTGCGRLIVEGPGGELCFFVPEDAGAAAGLLRSAHGERWKRPMAGVWRAGRGELWWGFGVADEGIEDFDHWDDLERRYHEVFRRLLGDGVLRSAFLRRDGHTVHRWPPEQHASD